MVVHHDVRTRLGNQHFNDRAVARTQQHGLHAAHLVIGITFHPDPIKNGADDVEARRFAGPHIQHKQAYAVTRFGRQRFFHHAVVAAVENGVIGLRGFKFLTVQHVERGTVHLAAVRIGFDVKLALNNDVLAIGLGWIALTRLHNHGAVHARGNVFQNHRRAAVVHEHARVVERELELDRLARRDGPVFVLRRHHGRMKIHRMHHRCGRQRHAGDSFVAAVGHAEADFVAHPCAYRRPWHLITKSPGTELHTGCDLDDLVGSVELHQLERCRVQRFEVGAHIE